MLLCISLSNSVLVGKVSHGDYELTIEKKSPSSQELDFYINNRHVTTGDLTMAREWLKEADKDFLAKEYERAQRLSMHRH